MTTALAEANPVSTAAPTRRIVVTDGVGARRNIIGGTSFRIHGGNALYVFDDVTCVRTFGVGDWMQVDVADATVETEPSIASVVNDMFTTAMASEAKRRAAGGHGNPKETT